MALQIRSEPEWETFFHTTAGIPDEQSKAYAKIFTDNRMTEAIISELSKDILRDLGITVVGDILTILKQSKIKTTSITPTPPPPAKPPPPKLPQLTNDMTLPQFRKFKIDWEVFKTITQLPENQIPSQLYNACNDAVQTSLINMAPTLFQLTEDQLLKIIESIVTQKSNPTVHRMSFAKLSQGMSETIQAYVIRLKSYAVDCEFSCPQCEHDLTVYHVKDQLIQGLSNHHLQTDILAKANQLKELTQIIQHAEAFEAAVRDQSKLSEQGTDESISRISRSEYQKAKQFNAKQKQYKKQVTPCSGCGSKSHGSWEREQKCPAWNTTCEYCNFRNHYASVCRKKETEGVNALQMSHLQISHVAYDASTDTFTSSNKEVQEITAQLTPFTRDKKYDNTPTPLKIFPDSGASVCIAGPKHLQQLGISKDYLIPSKKKVTAVGGSQLTCHGWIPIKFDIGTHSTKQPLYICDKVDRIYFSRKGCTDTKILPGSFPFPMDDNSDNISAVSASEPTGITSQIPSRPAAIPFTPTEENVPKLEKYLLEKFASTAFNRSPPFPTMSGPPAHIHVKPDAKPVACHTPIPIPLHLKEAVKTHLDEDVTRGIIVPVPVNEPTFWCSQMVITQKKDGSIRRTIDLQHLNAQCLRETHHTPSPFQLACQVPPHTKKSILDAVDGYHSVALDEESQKLTTFITEWGRYRYTRLTQGHMSAGDSYTYRYDDLIREVGNKVKCVDDALLYEYSIEKAFFHVWDYLTLCSKNGIVINADKFEFCKDTVTFAGLTITPTGIAPSENLLSAIKDFPPPKDITGARSWFGLVNQASWAYAISDIMLPFRELVQHNAKFKWNATLQKLFEDSKVKLLDAITEGIRTYDTSRPTCLQCDWSKDGVGYLLLQQHCSCPTDNAPNCCQGGWKLVYAGSRFTKPRESRYAPVEGEALAVSWSLNHARMFVLGCQNLIVVTDHKPLLGLFSNRDLGTITNSRVQRYKSQTLRYRFTIQHCPGKWHRGPDALSRYPVAAFITESNIHDDDPDDAMETELCEDALHFVTINAIHDLNSHCNSTLDCAITLDTLANTIKDDKTYQLLLKTIQDGFPRSRSETPAPIRNFWETRQRVSTFEGIALLDQRLVIPLKLRTPILHILHSAHQGCTGMKARAESSVYWPGINSSILNFRAECRTCTTHAPSQSKEPLMPTPPAEWPFQQICGDYFALNGKSYLTVVDRFSGWICVYHFPESATATQLISICRSLFTAYGAPEEFSSDGGSQFTSQAFQDFLKTWGVKHRKSSVEYPQSNGRAELGVKASKRIIHDNVSSNGSLDNDKAARAIMQYCNTPLPDIKLSPAQILFHRQIRDHLPAHCPLPTP